MPCTTLDGDYELAQTPIVGTRSNLREADISACSGPDQTGGVRCPRRSTQPGASRAAKCSSPPDSSWAVWQCRVSSSPASPRPARRPRAPSRSVSSARSLDRRRVSASPTVTPSSWLVTRSRKAFPSGAPTTRWRLSIAMASRPRRSAPRWPTISSRPRRSTSCSRPLHRKP